MNQKLIIVRGPACSGKTTICRELRNFDEKIAWISVDRVKEIYSNFENRTLDEVHKSVNALLADLLDRGYIVVVDGIFKQENYYLDLVKIADNKKVPHVIYQLECSLPTLLKRDKSREGAKIWGPLGDDLVTSIYNTVQKNPIDGANILNTEELTLEECIAEIRTTLG